MVQYGASLKTLKIELPYDSSIPLLGYISKREENSNSKKYIYPNVTALFTIAKTWKQPKCPSADEWIKMWCIYHGMLLSHKKE